MDVQLRSHTATHLRRRRAGAPLLAAALLVAVLCLAVLPAAASATTIWRAQTSGVTGDIYGVSFTSVTIGWAVGASGTILATTDGGTSWTAQTSNTTSALNGVAFTNVTTGWAVGAAGTILATSDDGATWQAQTSGSLKALYGVSFTSATTGWAVGAAGTIRATTDGGATWTAQTSNATSDLYGVAFTSATTGWAVGAAGTILATSDGGTTWTAQTSHVSNNLRAAAFTSATSGWVVGASGTILATSDGGSTWTAQTSHVTNNLRAVTFASATTGWAVGASGTILATTDGGATWTAQTSNATSNLLGVAFTSATTGWAVGYSGNILAYASYDSPTITVGGADTSWHNDAVELTVRATVDERLTLASLAYSTDGATTWTEVPGSGTMRTLTISSEGTTNVTVRAIDSGGQTASDSATVKIDTTQPGVSVSGGGSSWRKNPAKLTIQATTSEHYTLAALEYSRNGGTTWSEVPGGGPSRTLTIANEGTSRISVRATDSAGQMASASATVKIDSVRPTSMAKALTLKWARAKKGKKVALRVGLKDARPSCGSATLVTTISTKSGYRLGRTTTKNVTVNTTRGVSVKLTKGLRKGTYYVLTRATDKAGNLQAKAGKVKLRVK